MTRTTLDLDPTVLSELKERQRRDGKSLGRLASELLASALRREEPATQTPFRWRTRRMGARIDLEDKEAVRRALDAD
jgi:hypothetical protein